MKRPGGMKRFLAASLLPVLILASGCEIRREHDEAADRAEIHALLNAYGSTLDARDFNGFAGLFAKDGTYVAGNGKGVSGTQAGAMMEQVFASNALGFREPNFHVFFNEVITLEDADHAHSTSMSFYMVPGEDGRPVAAMMARYHDELVRETGKWKFARRRVESLMPPPQPSASGGAQQGR
ncbi:nuclear transport factor 2 family protein [Altererythrobacter fulvus]|uniref:nuclear transport factor 2 family protein n=1 Tax=Caenibius fulvus TaxID=2126012 RepID=UPI0030196C73